MANTKEAKARIKINKLLEESGWRFFDNEKGQANISLEPNVKLTQKDIDAFGEDFESTKNGFIDFLLLDEKGFPLVILEAKKEDKNPLDGKGPLEFVEESPVNGNPLNPLDRKRIVEPLSIGVKALDGVLTVGKGQRIGIFSGSGVGKSTLLGMVARNTSADVNVIALVGERGREVREFLEKDLGEEGLKRSVVVVATSDQPALVRLKGALVATSIAEHFRDQGLDVMLMMDSVTRFAMAQREVGLAVGEPPATRGYTPSVFALLPKLLERSGTSARGTITGLYTVLVEGDDTNEPIADAVRGILDGHVVLTRDLAMQNHYPAIDVLASVSRVMIDIVEEDHRNAADELRSILATYRDAKDLIDIGAYAAGSNPKIDYAISKIDAVNDFLKQGVAEKYTFESALELLKTVAGNVVPA